MCSDLLNMFPNIASIDWSMSMFAFDAMALNEHINPKMLMCQLTLFCKMVLIHLETNQLIDTYS